MQAERKIPLANRCNRRREIKSRAQKAKKREDKMLLTPHREEAG
jgi:hypothetical protein